MIGPTRLLKWLIQRLSGVTPRRDDPAEEFRRFAAGVERRVAGGAEAGPKVRVAGSPVPVGAWR